MKIFLDTSSLFKLYHFEVGTKELESVFLKNKVSQIYLSEITKVEFNSSIWKKVRTKEISLNQAIITLNLFDKDSPKYQFVAIDSIILEQAKNLVSKYGVEGLRTLDSIQLSTCVFLKNQVDVFFTTDKLLKALIEAEQLKTEV